MNPRLLPPARVARSILRTQSDERLAELAADGSDAAFEALVARHRRSLVAYCSRFVGATDAEEAAQDALLRALGALRRGDEIQRVAPWLHVIARNAALNVRRSRSAGPEAVACDVELVCGATDDAIEGRARLEEVVAAVGALPERQREAIVMRELEGRSYDEIAVRLDSTPSAVRQLLHRARDGVRSRLAGLLPWEPFLRWAASVGPGSRVAALSDTCFAAAKVCAALVPAALGISALDHGTARPAVTQPAHHHAAALAVATRRPAGAATQTAARPASVSATRVARVFTATHPSSSAAAVSHPVASRPAASRPAVSATGEGERSTSGGTSQQSNDNPPPQEPARQPSEAPAGSARASNPPAQSAQPQSSSQAQPAASPRPPTDPAASA